MNYRDRGLVYAAIEERMEREGISRQQAATEILDQEHEWRREELAASRYSLWDEFAEIGEIASGAVRRLTRRSGRGRVSQP